MSTYSGDAQIVETKSINGDSSSFAVIYTVPAGRFAEVVILEATKRDPVYEFLIDGSLVVSNSQSQEIAGGMLRDSSGEAICAFKTQLLTAGEQITVDEIRYKLRIKEFNNP